MSDLFSLDRDRQPAASLPDAAGSAPAVERPAGWRAPTARDHVCHRCGGLAVFGQHTTWFCRAHAPADFFPSARESRP
jgi:hypothetical protein